MEEYKREDFDELFDCIFSTAKSIRDGHINLDHVDKLKKEYAYLIKIGYQMVLDGKGIPNVIWKTELLYYMNQHHLSKFEILELQLLDGLLTMLQSGLWKDILPFIYPFASGFILRNYAGWVDELIASQEG